MAGDVLVGDGRVVAVGVAPAGRRGMAVPGFVDLQVNGFAGVDFLGASRDDLSRAGAAMAATGVTAYVPTLVSSPPELALATLRTVGELAGEGPRVLGAHLEGPFLSPHWPGAHDPADLRAPDHDLADRLCDAGPVRMVTLAPELSDALSLVDGLRARGVVVSCGQTDAEAATAHAAFDRGVRAITHVHNAHRRWSPRDPGPAGAAVVRPDVTVMAIVDGVHLAAETVLATWLAVGDRLCLVTDAVAAAGLRDPDRCRVAGRAASVADGAVRLADGALAGSLLTLDRGVRNLVDLGVPIAQAVHGATAAPARLLGAPHLGALRQGGAADIAVLDDRLEVTRTLVAGNEVFAVG